MRINAGPGWACDPARMSADVLSPPRVVIVEDDSSLLGALAFSLETEGYEVASYVDAAHLLAAPPRADCLVVDQKLPDLDGLGLIRELRALGNDTPAILITTRPDERCRRAAAQAGVQIVEKPLVDSTLRRAIEAAVLHVRN
jgi:FixJ family two-component response regulator